jgi:large subunit ribosomal protein L20
MRVTRGTVRHRRHKALRKKVKGYRGMRRTSIRKAKEAVLKAGEHAYRDRRKKKRVFRSLWIIRLNAAVREKGMKYSQFVKKLNDKNIAIDRKVLSELAINEPDTFEKIVEFHLNIFHCLREIGDHLVFESVYPSSRCFQFNC